MASPSPRLFLWNPSRRPQLRIPENYPRSSSDANWSEEALKHDFIMPPTAGEPSPLSAATIEAINTANNKVLPLFFEFDYLAKRYQNRFYWVQYTFVIGAFITTLLGALTVATNQNAVNLFPDHATVAKLFGALGAVAGVITGFATLIQNREKPQEQWYKYRRWAEILRTHYFEYLTYVAPYAGPDRTEKLDNALQDLKVEELQWQKTMHQ